MKPKITIILKSYNVPAGRENFSRNLIKKVVLKRNFMWNMYCLLVKNRNWKQVMWVNFSKIIFPTSAKISTKPTIMDNRFQQTNDFVFHQNIHALYTTFAHSFEKLSFMAGLRAEQALITSNLITLDSIVPNNYFRLYPTLHLAYEFSDEQQIQLNYSHRVRRPDSDEMNPFPEYSDPRNMEAGNPQVKPEQIHSIEFGYQLKKEKLTIQPTVYYRYRYDAFTEIRKF